MGKKKDWSNKFQTDSHSGKVSVIPFETIDLKGYKNEDSELITIEASCVTGFELAATHEVKRKLAIENVHEIMGRVVFDIPLSKLNQVMKLRTVDNIWVIIGAKSDFDFSLSEEESIKNISDFTLNHLLWNKGLKAWNSVFEFYENLEDFQAEKRPKLEDKIPKFRCTCYRTGENVHKFSSMDVAKNVGGQIQEKFQWSVKMKDFDIEVVVNIDSNQAYFGIGLTHQSLYKRNIEHFGPTTLRATICASMLELADIQPGEIVVDPMCGGGSIPIEGAVAFKNGFFLAGDYHDLASQRTGNNLKAFGNKIQADSLQWDATRIPLREDSVDVLISDLPFGKRSGSKADNRVLYPQVLLSMARVVKPKTGRAVLLTQDKTSMFKSAGKFSKFWKINRQMYCNIGGLAALVFLMNRTEEKIE